MCSSFAAKKKPFVDDGSQRALSTSSSRVACAGGHRGNNATTRGVEAGRNGGCRISPMAFSEAPGEQQQQLPSTSAIRGVSGGACGPHVGGVSRGCSVASRDPGWKAAGAATLGNASPLSWPDSINLPPNVTTGSNGASKEANAADRREAGRCSRSGGGSDPMSRSRPAAPAAAPKSGFGCRTEEAGAAGARAGSRGRGRTATGKGGRGRGATWRGRRGNARGAGRGPGCKASPARANFRSARNLADS